MNFSEIQRLGEELAKEEGLRLHSIGRAPRSSRGLCKANGEILIRMNTSTNMWQSTKDVENLRTLAHELAHLKHFHHGKEFWSYAEELCKKLSSKVGFTVKPEQVMMGV